MNRTVFVLGAGASCGDDLLHENGKEFWQARTPLIPQFFAASFLKQYDFLPLEKIGSKYRELITYVREAWDIQDPFGMGIEDVFTGLAIEHEFSSHGTDEKALCQLLQNLLI